MDYYRREAERKKSKENCVYCLYGHRYKEFRYHKYNECAYMFVYK
jgi:hypothetical protein